MFWIQVWSELAGSILAAAAVRMAAGTPAGLVTFALLIIEQLIVPGSSFVLPLALVIFALLKTEGTKRLFPDTARVTASLSVACVWNANAVQLVPVAAFAFVFRSLAPKSGNHPYQELKLAWTQNRLPVKSAAMAVLLLPAGLAALLGHAKPDWPIDLPGTLDNLPGSLAWLTLPLAVIAFAWLLMALREADGTVVALSGLPLASLAVDPLAASRLLLAACIALAGLVVISRRLKRRV